MESINATFSEIPQEHKEKSTYNIDQRHIMENKQTDIELILSNMKVLML